jgi:DNA polymerase elongation subunit (family B)
MSRDVQIIDVEYRRDENTYKSYMLLTCLDTNNKHVYINVHNLTFKIYCALDHGTTQDEVDELGRKLFDKLRDDNIHCRRTQCECKNEPPLDWVVSSEKYTQMCSFPCTKHLKKRYDVYLGSEVVYDYGYPVYEEIKRPFACFKFSDYEFCTQACKLLNYLHTCKTLEEHLRGSYGLSLDPISEFFKAVNIYSYSWIRVPLETDDITPDQIEPLLKDERFTKPNEFYYDIETLPPPGERVTIPTRDPVICISVLINTVPIVKKVFAWVTGPVAPGETEIVECHSEKELLTRFFAFVQEFVPDITIGFNHIKFDTRYLNIRARLLGISPLNTWVKNKRMREMYVRNSYERFQDCVISCCLRSWCYFLRHVCCN